MLTTLATAYSVTWAATTAAAAYAHWRAAPLRVDDVLVTAFIAAVLVGFWPIVLPCVSFWLFSGKG